MTLPEPYYTDDAVTIYHGDARELLPLVDADVMVTDPPYGIGWKRSLNGARGSKAHAGIAGDADTSLRDMAVEVVGEMPAVVFGSFYVPYPPRVRQVLVWHKPADAGVVGATTGWRRDAEPIFLTGSWPKQPVARSAVMRSCIPNIGSPSSPAGRTGHPHAKPVDLMREIIEACPLGVIVDPFMGSGSTLRAAKDLGRKAIGIEIDERYCRIAADRMRQEVLFGGAA